MTTLSGLNKQGLSTVGITYSTGVYSFNISDMNAVITAYNTANNTNYAIWDTVNDNYEKFYHFLMVFTKIQNLLLGNDSFNIKWISTTPQNQTYGTRGSLNSRVLSFSVPFASASDVDGDPDNLG